MRRILIFPVMISAFIMQSGCTRNSLILDVVSRAVSSKIVYDEWDSNNGEFSRKTRTVYNYDSQDRLENSVISIQSGNNWINMEKSDLIWNRQGLESMVDSDFAAEWKPYLKFSMAYRTDGNVDAIIEATSHDLALVGSVESEQNRTDTEYVLSTVYEMIYSDEGRFERMREFRREDTEFDDYIHLIAFDSLSRYETVTIYDSGGTFKARSEYDYDKDGRLIGLVNMYYDGSAKQWRYQNRNFSWKYNEDGLLVEMKIYGSYPDLNSNLEKITYEYDEMGRLKFEDSHQYPGSPVYHVDYSWGTDGSSYTWQGPWYLLVNMHNTRYGMIDLDYLINVENMAFYGKSSNTWLMEKEN